MNGQVKSTRELPERLEVCARDRDGTPCLGVLYRPTPDLVYRVKCGGQQPGVRYVLEEKSGGD